MRESNFAFPAQNKACVCITSQLYDRRALDTTAPLPLFNSLTHLTYLTSTSPRIREIMTMDGGLERLVRILHDFCICPPPPENPAILYGLTPPSSRVQRPAPALNPPSFDKHAAYRFSLAFQCIVNIGVRGSEPIRSRVVQAGTLDVVGCILEAWLANKGFAVGPSATASGLPRETREQRQQRRLEHRQREEAAHLQRALQRQLQVDRGAVRDMRPGNGDDQDDSMDYIPSHGLLLLSGTNPSASASTSNNNSDTDVSADASIAVTPQGSGTPTGSVVIPARDRSGTVIGRPVWDQPQGQLTQRAHHNNSHHNINHNAGNTPMTINTTLTPTSSTSRGRRIRHRELPPESPSPSPSEASRQDTETEDDGEGGDAANTTDNDVDMSQISASASASPSPDRRPRHAHLHAGRRTVGIVADESDDASGQTLQLGGMGIEMGLGIGGLGGIGIGGLGLGGVVGEMGMGGDDGHIIVGGGEGMEAGIVALDANDDFAMGAPPGAPGALGGGPAMAELDNDTPDHGEQTPRTAGVSGRRNPIESAIMAPDVTPRAALVGLPSMGSGTSGSGSGIPQRSATLRGRPSTERGSVGSSSAAGTSSAPAQGNSSHTGRANPSASISPIASASASATASRIPFIAFSAATATAPNPSPIPAVPTTSTTSSTAHHTHREPESGPYRDEDVLLSLQLLAYLSKYPHVRQAFYKPRVTFHPASVGVGGARFGVGAGQSTGKAKEKEREKSEREREKERSAVRDGFFKSFGGSRTSSSKASSSSSTVIASAQVQPSPSGLVSGGGNGAPSSARQTNVFSLVERFTFKPSSSEGEGSSGSNVPPRLPPEIQYWAGVIMRNACRKDDSRGGIRQCANMMCGKWETYPREFAKCRRCRKAKYCGKECQSTAWSEGHRFWCSARDVEEDGTGGANSSVGRGTSAADTSTSSTAATDLAADGQATGLRHTHAAPGSNPPTVRAERQRQRHGIQHGTEGDVHPLNTSGTVRGFRPPGTDAGITYVSPTAAAMASGAGVRAEPGMSRDRTVVGVPTPSPHHTHGHRARLRNVGAVQNAGPATGQTQDPTNTNFLSFHIQGSSSNTTHHPQDTISRRRAETITGVMNSSTSRPAGASSGITDMAPNVVLSAQQRPVMPVSAGLAVSDWPMNIGGGGGAVLPNANTNGIMAGPSRRHRLMNLQTGRSPPPSDDRDDIMLG